MQSTAFNGILRQSGGDLARLQRLGDPLVAAGLFQLLEGQYIPEPSLLLFPSWLWALVLTALLLWAVTCMTTCGKAASKI